MWPICAWMVFELNAWCSLQPVWTSCTSIAGPPSDRCVPPAVSRPATPGVKTAGAIAVSLSVGGVVIPTDGRAVVARLVGSAVGRTVGSIVGSDRGAEVGLIEVGIPVVGKAVVGVLEVGTRLGDGVG